MGKRIIVLSDGTGNAAAKVWRTNVWRTFEALDLRSSNQIAIYDDGVGTSSFKPMALLGGAFGVGLKRNVLGLYKFLCRNYKSAADYAKLSNTPAPGAAFTDDQLFLFGFSRGAFTVRFLAGLVLSQGLVEFDTEDDLDSKVRAAYRAYRTERYKSWTLETPIRLLRNLFATYKHNKELRPVSSIEFIGVWDTVAAYGSPIDEMTRGFSQYIWPLELPNHVLGNRVVKARHALAIDEERTAFAPELWEEPPPPIAPGIGGGILPANRLLQVWFSGVHANVGGGYPDDSLANVSLTWMMAEARDSGLKFKTFEPDAEERVKATQDKDGRLYDSRAGLGGYYRYGPRRIKNIYPASVPGAPLAKIHESAFARIYVGAHLYAPITLPDAYDVVQSADRSIVPLPATPTPGQFATVASAAKRHDAQESVWNIVWKRRAIYFLTVFASGYTALYPLVRESYAFQEMATRLRIVSDTIKLVGFVLPNGLQRWLDGYARDPGWFLLWAGTIAFLIWYGATLKSQTNSRMRRFWDQYLPGLKPASVHPTSRKKWTTAWSVFIAVLVYVAVYPILEQNSLLRYLTFPEPVGSLVDAYTQQPFRLLLWTFLSIHFAPERCVEWLRTRSIYQSGLKALKLRFAPAFFALAILYMGFAVINHVLFNVRDSFGAFCKDSEFNGKPLDRKNHGFVADKGKLRKTIDVYDSAVTDGNSLCFATNVFAQRGQKYAINIQRMPPKEAWTFWNEPAFFGGQPVSQLVWWKQPILVMLYPFRRTLDRPWSSFIVRYGPTGNEESFLDREQPILDDDLDSQSGFEEMGVVDDPGILGEAWTAKRDGEVYVYLNKPVLGIWGIETVISKYLIPNTGKARITIVRM